jgi:hypothetical protein
MSENRRRRFHTRPSNLVDPTHPLAPSTRPASHDVRPHRRLAKQVDELSGVGRGVCDVHPTISLRARFKVPASSGLARNRPPSGRSFRATSPRTCGGHDDSQAYGPLGHGISLTWRDYRTIRSREDDPRMSAIVEDDAGRPGWRRRCNTSDGQGCAPDGDHSVAVVHHSARELEIELAVRQRAIDFNLLESGG